MSKKKALRSLYIYNNLNKVIYYVQSNISHLLWISALIWSYVTGSSVHIRPSESCLRGQWLWGVNYRFRPWCPASTDNNIRRQHKSKPEISAPSIKILHKEERKCQASSCKGDQPCGQNNIPQLGHWDYKNWPKIRGSFTKQQMHKIFHFKMT